MPGSDRWAPGSGPGKLRLRSPSGKDIFFTTAQSLLSYDPGLVDVYDARVEGGLPEPAPPAPGCEGEACQGPIQAPNDPTPASSSFEGPGNVHEKPAKQKKKKKHKKKSKKSKKKSKKHAKKTNKRPAGRDRRADR